MPPLRLRAMLPVLFIRVTATPPAAAPPQRYHAYHTMLSSCHDESYSLRVTLRRYGKDAGAMMRARYTRHAIPSARATSRCRDTMI